MGHSPLVHLQTYGRRIVRPALLRKVAGLASARSKPMPEKQQSTGGGLGPRSRAGLCNQISLLRAERNEST